jgi:hypothetical protein
LKLVTLTVAPFVVDVDEWPIYRHNAGKVRARMELFVLDADTNDVATHTLFWYREEEDYK